MVGYREGESNSNDISGGGGNEWGRVVLDILIEREIKVFF